MPNNLGRTELAPGQTSNQYATVNSSDARIDGAITAPLDVSVSTAGSYTVSTNDLETHQCFNLIDAGSPPLADFGIVFDQDNPRGVILVRNLTSFDASVTATGQTLPAVVISSGASQEVYIGADDAIAIGVAAGEGTGPIATSWRVMIHAGNNGVPYVTVGEVQFRHTAGVAETMSTVGGTITGSVGPISLSPSDTAALVYDGTTATRFGTDETVSLVTGRPLQFNFTTPRSVAEIMLQAPNAFANEMIKDADVQYWDGAAWVTVMQITNATGWSTNEVRTFGIDYPPTELTDAPIDGKTYGRKNAAWSEALPIAGGTLTGPLQLPAGSQASPSLRINDDDSGWFAATSTMIGYSINNNQYKQEGVNTGASGNPYQIVLGGDATDIAFAISAAVTSQGLLNYRRGGGAVTVRNQSEGASANTNASYSTASTPAFQSQRGRGTMASPAVVQNNDGILNIIGFGYDGAVATRQVATVAFVMFETTPSTTAMGGRINFNAIAPGTVTNTNIMSLDVANGLTMFTSNKVISENRHFCARQYAAGSLPTSVAAQIIGSSDIATALLVGDGTRWLSPGVAVQTFTANGTISIPKGWAIDEIFFENTTANAVTGGVKIGTTSGATDVVAAQAVGANALDRVADASLLKRIFSTSAAQTLFVQAVTAWNSASVNISFVLRKVL